MASSASARGKGKSQVALHPSKFLKEMLKDLGTSKAEFVLLYSRAFGRSPQYSQNLQVAYDLWTAKRDTKDRLRAVRPVAPLDETVGRTGDSSTRSAAVN